MINRRACNILLAVGLVVLLGGDQMAWAQSSSSDSTTSIYSQLQTQNAAAAAALAAYQAGSTTQKLPLLQAYGDQLITVRSAALTKLTANLSSGFCETIDPTVKSALTADITTVQSNLNSQKTAIDAAATLVDARTNVIAVFTGNLVFEHFIPAINGACIGQMILDLITSKLTPTVIKLQQANLNATAIQTDLANANSAAASALLLYEQVAKGSGTDSGTNATALQSAASDLTQAKQDLTQAKTDFLALKTTATPTTAQ